jgi:hypothetical protein
MKQQLIYFSILYFLNSNIISSGDQTTEVS